MGDRLNAKRAPNKRLLQFQGPGGEEQRVERDGEERVFKVFPPSPG